MVMHRVRTVFTGIQGTPWLNTLFFDAAGGTAQEAATAAGGFWGAVDAVMTTQVDWTTEPDVPQINEETGALIQVTSTTPVTGTGAAVGEIGPVASQGLIRWRTSVVVNGRNLRGRTFVPGLTVAAYDDGGVIAGTKTAIDVAAAALIASATADLVIWHRPSVQGASDGSVAEVVTGSLWTQLATMRSRRD
jgi:hypothetical protein